jgi:hypothetical protein
MMLIMSCLFDSRSAMSIPWDLVETSTWEVHLDGPTLTHVQSICVSALSYEMCSHTSIFLQYEMMMTISDINLRCYILSMIRCFMLKLLSFNVKYQIVFAVQQFHDFY